MPIYAYKCESCGHAKDVLRKISDEPLTVCPQCGQPTFTKQVTAAGFQLKGSGWYVTDFRGGNTGNGAAPAKSDGDGAAAAGGDSGKSADSATTSAAAAPASSATPAPAAAPAAASASKSAGGDSSSAAKTS